MSNGGAGNNGGAGGAPIEGTGGDPQNTGGHAGAPTGGRCGVIAIPMTVRDFTEDHMDFGDVNCVALATGAVESVLDAEQKPVLAQGTEYNCITAPSTFEQWYRDVPDTNATFLTELVLWDDGAQGFVNRYGENGERFAARTNEEFESSTPEECAAEYCAPCSFEPSVTCSYEPEEFDGDPVFFPMDDADFALDEMFYPAVIPGQYGYTSWPAESEVADNARDHNFYFTTELAFDFTYSPADNPVLTIQSDDDTWVFVDGTLALDLGGVHEPTEGTVEMSALGLTEGQAHAVKIFHAKRKREASTYRLRLTGFGFEAEPCDSN